MKSDNGIIIQQGGCRDCPFCGATLPETAKMCFKCGRTLPEPQKPTCPVCKSEWPDGRIICPNCGYRYPSLEFKNFCVQPESEENLNAVQDYIDRENSKPFRSRDFDWDEPPVSSFPQNLKWLDPVNPFQKKALDRIPPAFLEPSPIPGKGRVPSSSARYYQIRFEVWPCSELFSCFQVSLWLCPKPCDGGNPPNGAKVMKWDKFYASFRPIRKGKAPELDNISCAEESYFIHLGLLGARFCTLGAFLLPLAAPRPGLFWPVLVISAGSTMVATMTNPFPLRFDGHGKKHAFKRQSWG